MTTREFSETFRSAVLAGVFIGIAGFGFLALGGVAGAVFFTFGLLGVMHYKVKLYTGYVGFLKSWREFGISFLVLAGNIVGTLLVALLAKLSPMDLPVAAQKILSARLAAGAVKCGLLAIGCGFIITTAVLFGREGRWLPLLFGVPLFIICGFPHCIADAFYYLTVPWSFLSENALGVIGLYLCLVAGNFIGCNFSRVLLWQKS